ncbi:hypothetical protein HYV11_02930 [Candidatus Dependentiae bacterium]|nr:hypothetical protein [Candidatus Dependentiae bacterium]
MVNKIKQIKVIFLFMVSISLNSRSMTSLRKVVDQAGLAKVLRAYGFNVVICENGKVIANKSYKESLIGNSKSSIHIKKPYESFEIQPLNGQEGFFIRLNKGMTVEKWDDTYLYKYDESEVFLNSESEPEISIEEHTIRTAIVKTFKNAVDEIDFFLKKGSLLFFGNDEPKNNK